MRKRAVLFVAILAVSAFFAAAQEGRFALVIGNAAYEGDAALANSVNDATDMANALSDIGWKVTKVLDADRKAMNRAVSAFRESLAGSNGASALLYYAGHGVQVDGANYLIPVGENFESPDDIKNDAVSLQAILDAFEAANVSTEVIILDACRNNPFAKKSSRDLGGSRGLNVISKPSTVEGSAILFATAPGQTAADGNGRNGIFTAALLKFIRTDLKLQDLVTKVTGEVKLTTGGKQIPYNSISLSDDYYLVPASLRGESTPQNGAGRVIVAATFQLVVEGAETGMDVSIDGSKVGQTPYLTKLDSSKSYVVEVSHPDWKPYRQVVNPKGGEKMVVQPELEHSAGYILRDLKSTRNDLTKRVNELQGGYAWVPWANGLGWIGALAGAGLSGYAYYQGTLAEAAYNGAVDQAGFDAAQTSMSAMNQLFQIGTGVAIGSLAEAVITLFIGPDTKQLKSQIRDLDLEINTIANP